MPKRKVLLDQFFTSSVLALKCIQELEQVVDLDDYEQILEPSAGSGRFLDHLPSSRTLGIDINPRDSRVQCQDFFTWSFPTNSKLLVVGNPPFGQRGALAVKFIDHAMIFADTVAFILPRSFNKFTFQNRVNQNFHLIHSSNHSDIFDYEGEEATVSVVFQVWQRSAKKRDLVTPSKTHAHFEMKHAHMSRIDDHKRADLLDFADLALPQVGAKFIPVDPETVTKGSYWFLKLTDEAFPEAFDELDFSFLEGKNTAHTSLSKADIVKAYNDSLIRLKLQDSPEEHSSPQQPLF